MGYENRNKNSIIEHQLKATVECDEDFKLYYFELIFISFFFRFSAKRNLLIKIVVMTWGSVHCVSMYEYSVTTSQTSILISMID